MSSIVSAPATRTTFGRPRPARRITVVTKQSISVIAEAPEQAEDDPPQFATVREEPSAATRLQTPRSFSNPNFYSATAGLAERDVLFEKQVAGALEKRLAFKQAQLARRGVEAVQLGQARDAKDLQLLALANRRAGAHARAQSVILDPSSPPASTPALISSTISPATPAFQRSHRRVASEASSIPTGQLPSLAQIRDYLAKQKVKEEAEQPDFSETGTKEDDAAQKEEGELDATQPLPTLEVPKARESRMPAFLKRKTWTGGSFVLPPSPTSPCSAASSVTSRRQISAMMVNRLSTRMVVA